MIDFHVHQPTNRETWGIQSFTATDYVEYVRGLGIDLSVVFTLDGLMHGAEPGNDLLAQYVAEAPDELVAFGTCAPRSPEGPREAERALGELGFRGLKFHPWTQGFNPHEPFMDPICEIAAAFDAPILFHDGTPPYSTALQIAALARRHPATKVVLGHGGLHDLWREAMTAVSELPNVHLCMSGPPPYVMRRIVNTCPLNRIVFGTDGGLAPLREHSYVAARVERLRALGLNDMQLHAILEANPRRLLNLAS